MMQLFITDSAARERDQIVESGSDSEIAATYEIVNLVESNPENGIELENNCWVYLYHGVGVAYQLRERIVITHWFRLRNYSGDFN